MEPASLMGVVDGVTNIAKEFQPLPRFQLMAVAILRNRETTHVLHHEIRHAGVGRPCIQHAQGVRQPVSGRFMIAANNEVSFEVSAYDPNHELVIDPVLVYSSYLGGSAQQSAINGMTLNAAGDIYVTGVTNAVDYPTTAG